MRDSFFTCQVLPGFNPNERKSALNGVLGNVNHPDGKGNIQHSHDRVSLAADNTPVITTYVKDPLLLDDAIARAAAVSGLTNCSVGLPATLLILDLEDISLDSLLVNGNPLNLISVDGTDPEDTFSHFNFGFLLSTGYLDGTINGSPSVESATLISMFIINPAADVVWPANEVTLTYDGGQTIDIASAFTMDDAHGSASYEFWIDDAGKLYGAFTPAGGPFTYAQAVANGEVNGII